MNLFNYIKRFPNEKSCVDYLRKKRENEGIKCKKCKRIHKHYWFEGQKLWKCSNCGSRTSLRAGTIMHKSKIPLSYWFMVIHLMTSVKKSFSAVEIQKQLGHKRYEPIWYMMQKIRISMGKRDSRYKLKGEIEVDDAYFEIVLDKETRLQRKGHKQPKKGEHTLKRGRGSDRQIEVLIIAESKAVSDNKNVHRPDKKFGHVKMIVMDNLSAAGINYEMSKAVMPTAKITTDGWRGYYKLPEIVAEHKRLKVPQKEAHKLLPWVHMAISNAKRLLLGTHHSIGRGYLQNYLNEFCYKLNRRYVEDDLFEHMMTISVSQKWNN